MSKHHSCCPHLSFGAILVTGLFMLAGCASHAIYPLAELQGPSSPRGTYYTLPRTVVNVTLPLTRNEEAKSQFLKDLEAGKIPPLRGDNSTRQERDNLVAEYNKTEDAAEKRQLARTLAVHEIYDRLRLLGISITHGAHSTVKLGIPSLSTSAEPDPAQVYLASLRAGLLEDRTLNLTVNLDGLPQEAASHVADKTLDTIATTFQVAASVMSKAGVARSLQLEGGIKIDDQDLPNVLRKGMAVLEAIESLRQNRLQLITGQTTTVGLEKDTLEAMLAQMESQERALIKYFSDNRSSSWNAVFAVRPSQDRLCWDNSTGSQTFTFCTFDTSVGISGFEDHLEGVPKDGFYGTGAADSAELRIGFSVSCEQPSIRIAKRRDNSSISGRQGFYYRVPAFAQAEVFVGKPGRRIASERLRIAQYGPVVALPRNTGSVSSKIDVVFHENLGSLKSVKTVSSADTQAAETAVKSAGALIESRVASEDELRQLERQQKILEAQVKILEAQKKLEQEGSK